jgi:hypothetical protein
MGHQRNTHLLRILLQLSDRLVEHLTLAHLDWIRIVVVLRSLDASVTGHPRLARAILLSLFRASVGIRLHGVVIHLDGRPVAERIREAYNTIVSRVFGSVALRIYH